MDQPSVRPPSVLLAATFAVIGTLSGVAPARGQQASEPLSNAVSVAGQALLGSVFRHWRPQRDLSELDFTRNGYPRTQNNLYCALPEPDKPVVIRSREAYDQAVASVREDPECAYFNRGPEIDFSHSALIGYRTSVPGCELFGTKRSASKSDRAGRVELKIEAKYTTKCAKPRSDSISWLKVPAFPESYPVVVTHRARLDKDWPER